MEEKYIWIQYFYIYLFGWLGFMAYQTFVGYLMPNPLLCKRSVLFQTIQSEWVHNLIVKNISISNYSVYSNSSNSAYSV